MGNTYSPNWRTVLRWALVFAAIVPSVQAGRWVHSKMNRPSVRAARAHKPIPYTVTLRETVHGPDGTITAGPEYTHSVRSDGSTLVRVVGKGSQRLLNYSSGNQIDTNEKNLTKSSINRPNENAAERQRDPDSNCLNSMAGKPMTSPPEKLLGEETIAGYRTAKITSGVTTAWYALDYGCALVKDRWEFSATEVSEKDLVSVAAGEPDPTLFDVPAYYREVTPSERILGAQNENAACNEHSRKVLKKLDEDYKRLKAKQQ